MMTLVDTEQSYVESLRTLIQVTHFTSLVFGGFNHQKEHLDFHSNKSSYNRHWAEIKRLSF